MNLEIQDALPMTSDPAVRSGAWLGIRRISQNLKRNRRDYCAATGEKVICLYFTMTRFRVRSPRITVTMSRQKFPCSKRIELVRESNTYWWLDKTKKLTLHEGLQTGLRKIQANKCVHIRVAARMPNEKAQ
jgi:hypothetical protein